MLNPPHETFYALRLIFSVGKTWHCGKCFARRIYGRYVWPANLEGPEALWLCAHWGKCAQGGRFDYLQSNATIVRNARTGGEGSRVRRRPIVNRTSLSVPAPFVTQQQKQEL